jgi:hypothetical protein
LTNASTLAVSGAESVTVTADIVAIQPEAAAPWMNRVGAITAGLASRLDLPADALAATAHAPPASPPQPPLVPPPDDSRGGRKASLGLLPEVLIGTFGTLLLCALVVCRCYFDGTQAERDALTRRRGRPRQGRPNPEDWWAPPPALAPRASVAPPRRQGERVGGQPQGARARVGATRTALVDSPTATSCASGAAQAACAGEALQQL